MRRHCALHVGAIPFLTSFSRYFLLSFDASCSPAPRAQSAPAITHVSSSHSHASCASRIIFMASLPIFLFFFTSLSSFFSRFTPHRSFRPVVPTPQFFAFFLTQLIVSILSPSVYSNMRLFVISLFLRPFPPRQTPNTDQTPWMESCAGVWNAAPSSWILLYFFFNFQCLFLSSIQTKTAFLSECLWKRATLIIRPPLYPSRNARLYRNVYPSTLRPPPSFRTFKLYLYKRMRVMATNLRSNVSVFLSVPQYVSKPSFHSRFRMFPSRVFCASALSYQQQPTIEYIF